MAKQQFGLAALFPVMPKKQTKPVAKKAIIKPKATKKK